ncbi:MAG: DUF624 domain-containing protein, partial [Clostridia bacterium]|nr:DUF624 domain-containing protein [Clostridia bacterium]
VMWLAVTLGLSFSLSFSGAAQLSAEFGDTVFALTILLALFLYTFIGGGAPTAGATYIIRNYTRDTHAWVWSDFWEHYKKNFLQGTIIFITDCVFVTIIMINIAFYTRAGAESIVYSILQGVMIIIGLLFLLMHMYVYPLLVTFKLKIRDIYKNSFLLTLASLPRTFLAFFIPLVVCGSLLYGMFGVSPYFILLLPIIYFVLAIYIYLSVSFPVVKKYMIDIPSQKKPPSSADNSPIQ